MTPRESSAVAEREGTGPKAQVLAVLAIHTKRTAPIDGYPADYGYCVEDRQNWPCATVQAIKATVCSDCEGRGYTVEPVMQCGGQEQPHACGVGCAVPEQFPCQNCTALAETKPRPISDEEPF